MSAVTTNRILLTSAARTATTASAAQGDRYAKGVRLYLNVTVASGTGGLQPQIDGYDRVSGTYVALSTGGTAIVATGLYVYEFYPTAPAAAGNVKEAQSKQLPGQWQANVIHGDTSSYTYSLSADVLR
jgi:hypothetical protein